MVSPYKYLHFLKNFFIFIITSNTGGVSVREEIDPGEVWAGGLRGADREDVTERSGSFGDADEDQREERWYSRS